MTLDLRTVAREAIASASDLDWSKIAESIVEDLDADATRDALRQALPVYLRQISSVGRTPEPVPTTPTTPAPSSRSWKVTAIRTEWKRRLETIYAVEGGARKRLGDFTADDAMFQAALNEANARKAQHRAEHWTKLAAELTAAGAATVRELEESSAAAIVEEVAR